MLPCPGFTRDVHKPGKAEWSYSTWLERSRQCPAGTAGTSVRSLLLGRTTPLALSSPA